MSDEADFAPGTVTSHPVLNNRTIPAATTRLQFSRGIWYLLSRDVPINVSFVKDTDTTDPKDNVAFFSSFGSMAAIKGTPFDYPRVQPDVRIKPEVLAPGYIIAAASDGNYTAEVDQCAVVSCSPRALCGCVTSLHVCTPAFKDLSPTWQ